MNRPLATTTAAQGVNYSTAYIGRTGDFVFSADSGLEGANWGISRVGADPRPGSTTVQRALFGVIRATFGYQSCIDAEKRRELRIQEFGFILKMFHEVADEPGEHKPAELYERYEAELVEAVEARGIDSIARESEVDEATLRALLDGEAPELTLEEGASILAALDETPDAETIATLSRDDLLMGMTTAVLDVEAVESGIGGELEAREIQSKVEGRFPMTLREFALLQQFIESKK